MFKSIRLWLNVYEGEGDDAAAKAAAEAATAAEAAAKAKAEEEAKVKSGTSKQFSQDDVNRMLAADRRKHEEKQQNAIEELEALRTKANLSDEERTAYDERIENMKNDLLTKEQLAQKETSKITKKHAKDLEDLTKDRDGWKGRFVEATIKRAITDAAVVSEAYRPEQIVAILRPHTQLTEELDGEGKPTGNLVPKVKLADKDKEGKPVTLELSPKEATKRMKEMDDYLNLFKGEGTGGLGGTNKPGGGKPSDAKTLAQKGPGAYQEARRSGKLDFK